MDTSEFVLQVEHICVSFVTDDPWARKWFHPRLGSGKLHEEPVVRLLIHNVKQGMCFFDVGACLGYYTVIASRAVGIHGVVHAFELDEFNCSILEMNLKRNDCRNVEVHHIAVSV
jgi:protein-L-isoaspartate O-methyltransferase